jgi:flagellar biogenesis protein FliO
MTARARGTGRLCGGAWRVACAAALGWPAWLWAGQEAVSSPAMTASAAIPFRSLGDSATPAPSSWGLAVLGCGIALAVLVWVFKRYGRQLQLGTLGGAKKDVQVLEKSLLIPGTHLVVVAYRGRRLLVAAGNGHTQCLRDDPMEPEGPAA